MRSSLIGLLIIATGLCSSASSLAAEQQLLNVKADGFTDAKLILVTDSNNRITKLKIAYRDKKNREQIKEFSPEEFKEGYTHNLYFFVKVLTVQSPDLNTTTGGKIQLTYRKEREKKVFEKHLFNLKKNQNGQWTLETINDKKHGSAPFNTLNLKVRGEKQSNGEYKFQSIDDYNFALVSDFNKLLAQLTPNDRKADRQVFAGGIRHPRPGEKPMIMAQETSESAIMASAARGL